MNRQRRIEQLESYAANTFVEIMTDAQRSAKIAELRAKVEAGRGEPGDSLHLSDAERLARIEQILAGAGWPDSESL